METIFRSGLLKKISLVGITVGSVTDIVATNLMAIPLISYAIIRHNLRGVPEDQFSKIFMDVLRADPVLYYTQLALGSLCSILGGYIAARIAKRNEVLNGTLAAFLCVGGGLYALLVNSTSIPIWQHLLGFISSPVLSAFGGYLRLKVVQRAHNA